MRRVFNPVLLVLVLLAIAAASLGGGCSRTPARARPPEIDADEAGQKALELYDGNGDGALAAAELDAVPGIRDALRMFDRDGNRSVSGEEIAARIRDWQADNTGLLMLNCMVRLDGAPLEGATVRLVPEPFLGENIRAAETVTRGGGQGVLRIADADLPSHLQGVSGVALGIYKIEVTHPSIELPARYNSRTELGLEVGHNSPEATSGRFTLALRKR